MNVLVIGGTRRSGPALVRELVAAGHRVTCLHRGVHRAALPASVTEMLVDRRNPAGFRAAVTDLDVDVVVDMIALNDADVDLVADCLGHRIVQYVVISSYDVYAAYEAAWFHRPYREPLPIAEGAPKATARYLYGRPSGYDKGLMEEAAWRAQADRAFQVTILRYPALYGPGDTTPREWYYVRQALDRRKFILAPNGGQALFSRGYVENAAHAVALAVGHASAAGQVYNVADDGQFTVRQIIDTVADLLGHAWEVIDLPDHLLPPHAPTQALPYGCDPYHTQPHLLLDTTKLRTQLRYVDLVAPSAALERTVRWLSAGRQDAVEMIPVDYPVIDRAVERWRRV